MCNASRLQIRWDSLPQRLPSSEKEAAMRLLDTEFKWVPSFATDVRETWRRFGYQPLTPEQRRARLRSLELPMPIPRFAVRKINDTEPAKEPRTDNPSRG
jgi:hypothetical protein